MVLHCSEDAAFNMNETEKSCLTISTLNHHQLPLLWKTHQIYYYAYFGTFLGSARQDRQRERHIQFACSHLEARLHISCQPVQVCRQSGHQVTLLLLSSLIKISGNKAHIQFSINMYSKVDKPTMCLGSGGLDED